MYYYTYLVICTEGNFKGKIYFGCHRTKKLNDGYIGSGRKLKDYLKKYPTGYYREIIRYYNSDEELKQAERELIKQHLNKDYCLNLCEGGQWGKLSEEIRKEIGKKVSLSLKGHIVNNETRKKISLSNKGLQTRLGQYHKEISKNTISNSLKGHKVSDETKQKISNSCKGNIPPNKNKKTSDVIKQKISQANKGKPSAIKGKHKVWDNKELNLYHFEQ